MKKFVFLISLIALLFSACSTINTVSFDRLEAADASFPEVVRRVGIINNIPTVQGTEEEMSQTAGVLEGDGKVMAETLAQEVAATNYFDEVVICDSALCPLMVSLKNHQGLKEEWQGHILSKAVVNEWIEKLGVDMLLSVERARIELKEGAVSSEWLASVPVIDGIITPMVRAYVPNREKPFLAIFKTDTIFWKPHSTLTFGKIRKEASEYAASMLMPYLLPYWKEVARNYYDGGCVEMRDAGVYVREGDWEAAYPLWKKLYDTKKGTQKMKAAFNLALYHEVMGDLDKAKEYIEVAVGLAKEASTDAVVTRAYQIQLESMTTKLQKLRIQMSRFEDKN